MATYDTIPLAWNDPLFDGVTNSGWVALPNGGMLSNKSITQTGGTASVLAYGSFTLDHVRISSNEAVRIGGSGDVNISNSWLEATGQPGDHADTIQAYAPGSTGAVTITNTAIVAHGNNATAGMFIADGYSGTFTFNNVVFQGGPFGLRIAADTDDIYVSLSNVYFVGPFTYAPFRFEQVAADIHITHWENVHYATIVNGELVPGALIQPPEPVEGDGIGAPTIDDFLTDSGTVGDAITNDDTLTLTGTAPANSTVKVYDGATLLGQTTATGSDAWSYTTAALANGSHSLMATATSGGTTSSPSSTLSVTVDTVAPNAPTIASFSTDTGTVGDAITSDNTLMLTGTAAGNSTVRIYDGTTLLGSAAANSSGAWSYTTGMLSDAIHSLTATATDAAGNTGTASTALNVTVATLLTPIFTSEADTVTLSFLGGTFNALGGNDKLSYMGGPVTINGGWGIDTVDFSQFGSAIWLNLADNGPNIWTQDSPDLSSGTWRAIGYLSKVENLVGTVHSDFLQGNNGANTFQGGDGNDTLTGGGGADTFVFDHLGTGGQNQHDVIVDFQSGVDRVDLAATPVNDFADLFTLGNRYMEQVGNDVLIHTSVSADTSILLQNVQLATLTQADFLF
jgi:hypothetical protein